MDSQSHKTKIILASSSPYRESLLQQLKIPFKTRAPQVDESVLPGEQPAATARRLAEKKGRAIARQFPDAIVIGSDQLAEFGGKAVGKPGNSDNASRQLRQFSGQTVRFHTSVAVLCTGSGVFFERSVLTAVRFRCLTEEEIQRYLAIDNPLDCAGSFKSESLGISLFESMTSEDPTAIVGLPLIAVSQGLRSAGINLP